MEVSESSTVDELEMNPYLENSSEIEYFGNGDSRLLHNILPEETISGIFDKIVHEIVWQEMFHKGGPVPRLLAIQGEIVEGKVLPIYRHPADEQPKITVWTETVNQIRIIIQEKLGLVFNHVLIQYYRSGHDYISEHSDKTLDITRGYPIINFSLGATRVMKLKSKPGFKDPKVIQNVILPNNSVFILGPETNKCFTHEIKQDKRLLTLKRDDELLEGGRRISFTFRNVATFLDISSNRLFGQGAIHKSMEELYTNISIDTRSLPPPPSPQAIINNLENTPTSTEKDYVQLDKNTVDRREEALLLLKAFSDENRNHNFDWDAGYGRGFDIVDFHGLL